ncbi:hypothetical protein BMJ32_30690 [Sinorhizobium medicae]|nr:hypothetical protein BMJ32_30690 [Sinorhizobium medicae]PLU56052.1 hypothetical protein BMJ23_15065 [Sinorhizobium medicae]PLU62347.1 hypothetical protein BMJ21_29200 [Sinorhizobium medicae]PLU81930.1 hypothetical protein BMJ22_16460 [Sinorhizobium medicae]
MKLKPASRHSHEQLVDVADMMRSKKRFAIPSRGCGRSIFWSITLATVAVAVGPRDRGETTRQRQK